MHPCELENSALAGLAKRLVEKTGTHLANDRKRDEERVREEEEEVTLRRKNKRRERSRDNLLTHSLLLY